MPDHQELTPMNVNIVYDGHQNETVFVVHTTDNNVYVVIGDDKSKVRRMINTAEINRFKEHPYIQALDLARPGLKQLSRHFDNIFIQNYLRKDEDGEEEKVRSIVYIQDKKPMIYDVSGSSDNLKQFKELTARVESKIEEKSGKKKEQKVKPMHSMSFIEFAEDNRRIKARLKFAFDDEMSKGVQVLSSGIYIELFDIKTNKAVPDCIDQLHVLYGNTYKQKEFHKEIAGLQALNVSTNVYRGRKPNQFCQNYQYSDI